MRIQCLFCTRPTCQVEIVVLKLNTVRGYTCCSTSTHYPDSEPTSLCSFSLMLLAQQRRNKQHFFKVFGLSNLCLNPQSTSLKANTPFIGRKRANGTILNTSAKKKIKMINEKKKTIFEVNEYDMKETRFFIRSLILNSHPNFQVNHFSYSCALKRNIGKLHYLLIKRYIFQIV